MSNEEVRHIAENVSFKPKGNDEKKLLWLINHSEKNQSDIIRCALNLLYFAKKTGRYEGLLDSMMDDFN